MTNDTPRYSAVYDDGTPIDTTPAVLWVLWYRLREMRIPLSRMEVNRANHTIVVTRE